MLIFCDFCLHLSEVEILDIKDGEDSLCSAFYGALGPLILSVMCNVVCVIRWVCIYRKSFYVIWCNELLLLNVHRFIDWSEKQLSAGIVKLVNKMKLVFRRQTMHLEKSTNKEERILPTRSLGSFLNQLFTKTLNCQTIEYLIV